MSDIDQLVRSMVLSAPLAIVARKNLGSGWGVDILWPDGETEVIKGFVTEYDAAKWIAEHSEAWREADRDLRTAR